MSKRRRPDKKGSKKLDKKKLLLVLLVAVIIFVLVFKIFTLAFSFIMPEKKHENTSTKTAQEDQIEREKVINVLIDPAKGGENKGMLANGGSQYEKDINLEIAKLIKDKLEKHSDVSVKLTRSYDEDMKLSKRAKIINDNKADIVISVRLNGQSSSSEASGIDTYYSNPSNSIVNDKENDKSDKKSIKSDDIKNKNKESNKDTTEETKVTDKNKVSEDTSKTSKSDSRKALSKALASSVQTTTLSFIDMKDRGIVEDDIDILAYIKMPAIVIHCGFISNKSDSEKLESDSYRSDLANGISEGTLLFIDKYRNDIIKDRINYR